MQRLFTMFPGGWPGAGLFVLRLAAAIPFMLGGSFDLRGVSHSLIHVTQFVVIGIGVLLLAGLWTPVAGIVQAIIEVWIFISTGEGAALHLLLAALGVSLIMLGPGAWSVDARLFGRKRIEVRRR